MLYPPPNDEPKPLEKSNQLERILLSQTFKRQDKPVRLLQRLVNDALAGIVPEEHQLGIEMFERRPDWVTLDDAIVRQNMTRLRGLLKAYYESDEGMEDRLNLELPGLKAVFSYNPRNPVERSLRLALKYVATDQNVALSHLSDVLSHEPDNAEAFAMRGETQLWRTMFGNEVEIEDVIEGARLEAQQALQYDQTCWRAHIVMAMTYSCRMKWKTAGEHFEAAINSSPDRAQFHPWYAGYLMAIGRPAEALELSGAMASGPSATAWPQLTHAAFLYAARRFSEAREFILQAKAQYPDIWLSHLIWSCVTIATHKQGVIPAPLLGMSMVQSLPDGTVVYSAVSLQETLLRLEKDGAEYDAIRGLLRAWVVEKEEAFNRSIDDDEPPPFRIERVSPFHLAIAYMTLGEYQRALALLRRDLERGHPLMAWLHIWPLFDPLRELPEFKQIVAKMNIPKSGPKQSAVSRTSKASVQR